MQTKFKQYEQNDSNLDTYVKHPLDYWDGRKERRERRKAKRQRLKK